MKKVILLWALVFTLPLFASGIDADATDASCDNTTLETYSGTANVEINWVPNTIETRWYNGNTQIAGPISCTYDDVLNVPSATLTKTGYTFVGWEVVPEYDFSTLPAGTNGIYTWSRNDPSCWAGAGSTNSRRCNNGDFDDLGVREWKTQFDYGMIYGTVLCSVTAGTTQGETGTPNETTYGEYCWCKATGFIPTNSNIKYAPTKSPKWAYVRSFSSECNNKCADWCSAWTVSKPDLRQSLYN